MLTSTGCGKSRYTVVRMENTTIISRLDNPIRRHICRGGSAPTTRNTSQTSYTGIQEQGSWLQVQVGRGRSSYSPLSLTLKLQLQIEHLSLRMTRRLAEQIFYNYVRKEDTTLTQVGGVGTQSSQDLPYSPLPAW